MSKRAALIVAIVVGGGLWVAMVLVGLRDPTYDAGYRDGKALADGLIDHPLIGLACVAAVAVAMIAISQHEP